VDSNWLLGYVNQRVDERFPLLDLRIDVGIPDCDSDLDDSSLVGIAAGVSRSKIAISANVRPCPHDFPPTVTEGCNTVILCVGVGNPNLSGFQRFVLQEIDKSRFNRLEPILGAVGAAIPRRKRAKESFPLVTLPTSPA
jgi:hypothetical protein